MIKICGITDSQSATAAAEAGADAIGLVFVHGSPRQVTIAKALRIVRCLPAFIHPVGLFVNATAEQIRAVAQPLGIGIVQLHGEEPSELAAALAPLRVIKAIPFQPVRFEAKIQDWIGACDNLAGVLIDAPPLRPGNAHRGGSGQTFDWPALARVVNSVKCSARLILAGGLTPQNVAEAMAIVGPDVVDVSSGVEASRGHKDATLIQNFCAAVRKADSRRVKLAGGTSEVGG